MTPEISILVSWTSLKRLIYDEICVILEDGKSYLRLSDGKSKETFTKKYDDSLWPTFDH